MKKLTTLLMTIGISIFLLTSCNNSGSNKTTEKDLELQKKELDFKQKELELKEKQLAMDSVQNANQKKTIVTTPKQKTQQQTTNTTTSSQSSTTVSLSPLMRSNMTFNLPTTSGRVISSMGKYSKIEYEDWHPSGWGNRYIWKFSNGLILTAQSDGSGKTPNNSDEVQSIFLEASNKNPIENLVYGLALNKTTKTDCQQLFGSKFQTTVWVNGTYKIYKDNLYTYLTFNTSGTLTEIRQVIFDLEHAN